MYRGRAGSRTSLGDLKTFRAVQGRLDHDVSESSSCIHYLPSRRREGGLLLTENEQRRTEIFGTHMLLDVSRVLFL